MVSPEKNIHRRKIIQIMNLKYSEDVYMGRFEK